MALVSAAFALETFASKLRVSSSISVCPVFTSSFTSTFTLRTIPESSDPKVTVRIGFKVPSAETVTEIGPRSTTCVT